jgi:hypothetical protein
MYPVLPPDGLDVEHAETTAARAITTVTTTAREWGRRSGPVGVGRRGKLTPRL